MFKDDDEIEIFSLAEEAKSCAAATSMMLVIRKQS
jgi:hypothetical protein